MTTNAQPPSFRGLINTVAISSAVFPGARTHVYAVQTRMYKPPFASGGQLFPPTPVYPALTEARLLGLLGSVLAPGVRPVGDAAQVQRPPDQLVPHTGAVLRPAASDQNHTVLLDVVALSRDVGRHGLARRQAHTRRLALARVGLLGPRDADLDAHTLALGIVAAGQGGGDGVTGSAGLAATLGEGQSVLRVFKGGFTVTGGVRTLRTWFSVAFCAGVEEKGRMGVEGLRKVDFATGRAVGSIAFRSDGIKRCLSIGIAMIVGGEAV